MVEKEIMENHTYLANVLVFLPHNVEQVNLKILRTIKLNLFHCAVEREGNHELVIFLAVH